MKPNILPNTTARTRSPGRDASAWTVAQLEASAGWIHPLDDGDRAELLKALREGHAPGQSLLDYRRSDFAFGEGVIAKLRNAFGDALNGRGVALVKGLPRADVSPEEFRGHGLRCRQPVRLRGRRRSWS